MEHNMYRKTETIHIENGIINGPYNDTQIDIPSPKLDLPYISRIKKI